MGIVSINIREFVKRAGEFTLNFIPARLELGLGFHCISSECPEYPPRGGGGGGAVVSDDWCVMV